MQSQVTSGRWEAKGFDDHLQIHTRETHPFQGWVIVFKLVGKTEMVGPHMERSFELDLRQEVKFNRIT